MSILAETYGISVSAEDLVAYIAAIAAYPAYTAQFASDLVQPGLRIPITAASAVFAEVAALGSMVQLPRADRTRPLIGDRRPPSPFGDIQPSSWPADYTTELLNVLNVLGRLASLEAKQAELLAKICAGPILSADSLKTAVGNAKPIVPKRSTSRSDKQGDLLETLKRVLLPLTLQRRNGLDNVRHNRHMI